MEPIFDGSVLLVWYQATMAWLTGEVFTPVNVVYAAMQIPAVASSGFLAWWVHDYVYPPLERRIQAATLTDHSRWVLLTLAQLIFPVLWASSLGISMAIAAYFNWPHHIVRIAINLLTAWIIIRLASIMVRDPVWSRLIAIAAYGVAVLNILDLLGPTVVLMDQAALGVGRLRISMLTVVKAMFSLAVLLWAAVLLSTVLERRIQRLPNLTPSVRVLFGKLLKASLVTLAIVVSLTSVGIDLTAIAVFSGAVGVGIGFGLQKVVSNLISGIILLLDKSIKPGDVIQIEQTYGWVSSLGARYVEVETRDGTQYLIPNEDIITKQVVNWTHQNDLARLKVQVRVAYDTDLRKALELMLEAAAQPARVLKEPKPNALMIAFSKDGPLDLELRFWVRDVQNGIRNISSEVMLEIWERFRAHGIVVPMPQRRLHIETVPELSVRPATARPAPDGASLEHAGV